LRIVRDSAGGDELVYLAYGVALTQVSRATAAAIILATPLATVLFVSRFRRVSSAAAQGSRAASLHAGLAHARGGTPGPPTLALTLLGGELGVPERLSRARLRLPAGLTLPLSVGGTCGRSLLASRGPSACPARSYLGRGHETLAGHAGSQTIAEEAALALLRAARQAARPGLLVFCHGETPLDETSVASGVISPERSPYGADLTITVPPIPSPADGSSTTAPCPRP
jgi:hypothetical protein